MIKRLTFIITAMLAATTCWSQVTVTGTVIFKEDKSYAPGVGVVEKGTKNGATTSADGTFSMVVTDLNATLEFVFIGYQPKEVELKGKKEVVVILKSDCNIDFFDPYDIVLYANSGVINSPVGGQIEMSSPYTAIGVVKGSYSYQTNLDDNSFQTAQIELSHPIYNCDFHMDFRWSYRNVAFGDQLRSVANSGEAQLNLRTLILFAGYSHLNMTDIAENKTRVGSGALVGIGRTWYVRPVVGAVSAKAFIYKKNVEFQAELEGGYRGFLFFVRYYKLASFNELSLGVGAQMNYYRRRK